MHFLRVADALILFAVGVKTYSAVEKHLQIGPHLVYRVSSGGFHHFAYHGQEPRGHARQVGDVLILACCHQCRQFFVPICHQSHFFARHAHHVHHRVDIIDERSRQVAYLSARGGIIHLVGKTAAQNECFAAENAARWIHIEV